MDPLEKLRKDVEKALRGGEGMSFDLVKTDNDALAVLDEFIAGHEVVEVDHYTGPGDRRCWDDCVLSDRAPETIIVPRDSEPCITDHTLTERMAVLEEELKHRCGNLGRRVNALESKVGVKVGGKPGLLEAAERAEKAMRDCHSTDIADFWDALCALAAAIKEERER